MTKEDIIKGLEQLLATSAEEILLNDDETEVVRSAISALNGDAWIPIEAEEKPNEYDDVLVCTDVDEVFKATYYGEELGFDDDNGNAYIGEITAWQPLPESYKKGE